MPKVQDLLVLLLFCMLSKPVHAQTKYALLVGVNNYYFQQGKSTVSLHGCINDVNSIKALLLNRFGFNEGHITTILNENATPQTVIAAFNSILKNCRTGDAFVFFYSGHGVWISNSANEDDAVKRGMNQAICLSNLYAPGYGCLLKDNDLKKIFNAYIGKKVTITTIFDCCFSGYLPMAPRDPIMGGLAEVKSIDLEDIPYIEPHHDLVKMQRPAGCSLNADGTLKFLKDTLDTDGDGLPNCADWQVYTPPFCIADDFGIGACPEEDNLLIDAWLDSASNPLAEGKSDPDLPEAATISKSYNLKTNINIFDPSKIKRPSEIPGSHFLSIGASSDIQKANEIYDECGNAHGALTKALLDIYKRYPAELSVNELLEKIDNEMHYQFYDTSLRRSVFLNQTPTYQYEVSRLTGNLVGVSPVNFKNSTTAVCISISANKVIVNTGFNNNISTGNVFSREGKNPVKIRIVAVSADSSTGIILKNTAPAIRVGDVFLLTDTYTSSVPFIGISIQTSDFDKMPKPIFQKIRNMLAQDQNIDLHSADPLLFLGFNSQPGKGYSITLRTVGYNEDVASVDMPNLNLNDADLNKLLIELKRTVDFAAKDHVQKRWLNQYSRK